MAGHNLKSASITNLDASPIVAVATGEGAPGILRVVNDFCTPVSADDTTSTYKLCRFPSQARIKQVWLTPNIATAGAGDVNIAFSDSTTDGTQPSLAGGVVQITGPVNNKLFGAAQTLIIANVRTDFTFKGTFTAVHQNLPIWQVLVNLGATQFTSDPGGFFDLQVNITTTITTSNGNLIGEVYYVE